MVEPKFPESTRTLEIPSNTIKRLRKERNRLEEDVQRLRGERDYLQTQIEELERENEMFRQAIVDLSAQIEEQKK
jgi:predicted nuclease with TOPRIM domain